MSREDAAVLARLNGALSSAQRELGEIIAVDMPSDLKGYASELWAQIEGMRRELERRARSAAHSAGQAEKPKTTYRCANPGCGIVRQANIRLAIYGSCKVCGSVMRRVSGVRA